MYFDLPRIAYLREEPGSLAFVDVSVGIRAFGYGEFLVSLKQIAAEFFMNHTDDGMFDEPLVTFTLCEKIEFGASLFPV